VTQALEHGGPLRGVVGLGILLLGCHGSDAGTDTPVTDAATDTSTDTAVSTDSATDGASEAEALPPLPATSTSDFQAWLEKEGLGKEDFVRAGKGGSFGGRLVAGEVVDRAPIVFVHGNSDAAVGRDGTFTGWDAARRHFLAAGFPSNALYGITWGPADASKAGDQVHERVVLTRLRTFFDAVKRYTGRPKITVIAHSMGVTLSRKAIEGGKGEDPAGAYDLGAGLAAQIDTFVGIAGANLGLTACYSATDQPTCDKRWGFYPGADASAGPSTLLAAMAATPHDEGAYVFSVCSKDDELLGFDGIVWGKSTCAIPGADRDVRVDGLGHVAQKDATGTTLEHLVVTHAP